LHCQLSMASSFNAGRSEVITKCPTPDELLDTALGRNSDTRRGAIARHVESCEACHQRIHDIRAVAAELHTVPVAPVPSDCLNDDAIAALAGGDYSAAESDAMAHVAACANCRARVAAITRLMDDAIVKSEISALDAPRRFMPPSWSRRQFTVTGTLLAAAAAAIVMLGPLRSSISLDKTPYRETAITVTSAPRIVSPTELTSIADSLRWTSVSQADLYRVRIWNTEGTVVWSTDTRDTTVTLPHVIQPGASYMWEVSARTGWDRWVSSDFVELNIAVRPPR
jgi:hypothetical protein